MAFRSVGWRTGFPWAQSGPNGSGLSPRLRTFAFKDRNASFSEAGVPALKAAAAKDSPRDAQMKIGGVIEPFYITPYVFYHDTGTSKLPRRSFLSEGLSKGMGMVELVLHRYL